MYLCILISLIIDMSCIIKDGCRGAAGVVVQGPATKAGSREEENVQKLTDVLETKTSIRNVIYAAVQVIQLISNLFIHCINTGVHNSCS